MTPRDEDEAWREIVEHYGDTPSFDEPEPPPAPRREPDPAVEPAWRPDPWEDEGRFVPPVPPPVPRARTRPRQVAWLGLFVAPAILLIAVVLPSSLPGIITFGLVAWFVGGFVYLVSQLPHGPQDPGDDGARL